MQITHLTALMLKPGKCTLENALKLIPNHERSRNNCRKSSAEQQCANTTLKEPVVRNEAQQCQSCFVLQNREWRGVLRILVIFRMLFFFSTPFSALLFLSQFHFLPFWCKPQQLWDGHQHPAWGTEFCVFGQMGVWNINCQKATQQQLTGCLTSSISIT